MVPGPDLGGGNGTVEDVAGIEDEGHARQDRRTRGGVEAFILAVKSGLLYFSFCNASHLCLN